MRQCIRCVLLLAPLGVFASLAAAADQVTLKNGDRISGTIQTADAKALLLKTDYEGDVTIQWDAVVGIQSTEDLTITLKNGQKLTGKVSTTDGNFVVAGAPSGTPPEPKANIVAVRNQDEQKAYDVDQEKIEHPKLWYFWSGTLDSGLALTRGNSSTASYTFDATAVRQTANDSVTLYGNYIFANTQIPVPAATTANLFQSGIRYDRNLSDRIFAFGFASFQTNELQNLTLRQTYGGGLGYHIVKTDNTTFDVLAGADYDRDEFSAYTTTNPMPPPPILAVAAFDMNSAEAVIGEEFDKKFSSHSTLNQTFLIFPNLSHPGEYRFQLNSAVSTQIHNWLSWQITFTDQYISYPPPGLKANDLVLSTGFRVTWGKAAQTSFKTPAITSNSNLTTPSSK
jgi:putative salt-induced outer membrane protein YdiY